MVFPATPVSSNGSNAIVSLVVEFELNPEPSLGLPLLRNRCNLASCCSRRCKSPEFVDVFSAML